ncbi:hypothetical protein LTR56_003773 [Elasticomyces elasticus]|nr:hypothetical protein LTR22_013167 [Elasticomyces elasticus]KAK3654915.1 hypothetical protein LTR56_003773 [Elasticomyces elasticus]KAK4928755.1 hypothetical protein LTR49_004564 [Elasticomyces elasticus]KAK5766618.1 hypothetical protein LTS12_003237 [Elasticomyces elasticus]
MSLPPPLPPRPEQRRDATVLDIEPEEPCHISPPYADAGPQDATNSVPTRSSSESVVAIEPQPEPALLYRAFPIRADEQIRILVVLPGTLDDELCGQLVVQDVDLKSRRKFQDASYRDVISDVFNLGFGEFIKKNMGTREDYIQDMRKWLPKTVQQRHQQRDDLKHIEKHLESSAQPLFDALSYTWGSWMDPMSIRIQGHGSFAVTRNLWSALRRIRSTNEPVPLWIDQICINQQDTNERNLQVRAMGNIYSLAWDVRIWLGDLPDTLPSTEQRTEKEERRAIAEQLLRVLDSAEPAWWTRTWCIQEFMMARQDPLVFFSAVEIRWTQMVKLGANIRGDRAIFEWKSQEIEDPLEDIGQAFWSYQIIKHMAKSRSLARMGWAISQTQATDPRDKVYSLLGLIDPDESALITIDYNKKPAWVFAEATYASIVAKGSLNIMHLVKQEKSTDITLPSWAVDFSHAYKTADQRWLSSMDISQYLFCDEPAPWCRVQDRSFAKALLTVKRRSLVVTGLQFDTVVRAIHERSRGQYWDEMVRGAKDLLKAPLRLVSDQPIMLTTDEQALFGFVLEICRGVVPYFRLGASEQEQASVPEYSGPPVLDSTEVETQMLSFRLFDVWSRRFLREHVSGLTKIAWRQYGLWKLYFRHLSSGDTFFITQKGFIGLAHKECRAGDVIALPRSEFLGFTYVNGIMNDELRKVVPELVLEERDFVMN